MRNHFFASNALAAKITKDRLTDTHFFDDFGQGAVRIVELKIDWVQLGAAGEPIGKPLELSRGCANEVNLELDFSRLDEKTVKCLLVVSSDIIKPLNLGLDIEGDTPIHARMIFRAPCLILGVFEKEAGGWSFGMPGITLAHPLEIWLSSQAAQQVMRAWHIGLPNPLQEPAGALLPEYYAHWLVHAPTEHLAGLYAQMRGADQGDQATLLLRALMSSWEDASLDQHRQTLIRALIADGADWRSVLKSVEPTHSVMEAIVALARQFPAWSRLFLETVDDAQILDYATTPQRADALYALVPARCLLGLVSESLVASRLECDIGL
ncbi:hypothetical protein [Pseudomonas sp. S1(2024)]|uniref:hypothetical protein n=1 Tax=Pseudomonas sp. S1(2024) TaxID=3390191 RepID=UPI00397BAF4F